MKKAQILLLFVSIMLGLGAITGLIIYLTRTRIITPEMGLLMLVAVLGCYIGFGVLLAVYRLIRRLE